VRDGDAARAVRDDLRLGMTVEARGDSLSSTRADGNDASTATSIVFAMRSSGRSTRAIG
jgi:hypothetical protein